MSEGIKETKELVKALGEIITIGLKAMADGKINIMDIPLIFSLIKSLGDAVEGVQKVPVEIKDLSAEEAQELGNYVLQVILSSIKK